jgi:hypothetical protein
MQAEDGDLLIPTGVKPELVEVRFEPTGEVRDGFNLSRGAYKNPVGLGFEYAAVGRADNPDAVDKLKLWVAVVPLDQVPDSPDEDTPPKAQETESPFADLIGFLDDLGEDERGSVTLGVDLRPSPDLEEVVDRDREVIVWIVDPPIYQGRIHGYYSRGPVRVSIVRRDTPNGRVQLRRPGRAPITVTPGDPASIRTPDGCSIRGIADRSVYNIEGRGTGMIAFR